MCWAGRPDGIETVVTDFKNGGFLGLFLCKGESFAYQGLYADNEFLHSERLFQVVVGTQLKPFHHIVEKYLNR